MQYCLAKEKQRYMLVLIRRGVRFAVNSGQERIIRATSFEKRSIVKSFNFVKLTKI